jgi:hypothetical protein
VLLGPGTPSGERSVHPEILICIQHRDRFKTTKGETLTKIVGKAKEAMEKTEVVTIGTCGGDDPHLVTTWGDYVRVIGIKDGEVIIVPAGGCHRTEENLQFL